MSEAPVNGGEMHTALRTALAELLPDMLREHQATPVAQVPAPPVAQTLRPSTWHPSQQAPDPASNVAPASAPATPAGGAVEQVRLKDDRDLDAFVRSLARRLEHPAERAAIAAGRIRFTMSTHGAAAPSAATSGGTERIDRGAVTERIIERAAESGGVLILGPKAVLTPMGRDRARALGVQIQREAAC
ncbi:MAG: hypothetical protein ACR2J9_11535 [Gaiellales bacterium]